MLYQRIRTFLEVANCLNFSVAAKKLYISQQAATKQISALEQELGVTLFHRTTRHVTLTPAGVALRNDFIQINRQINDSIKRVKAIDSAQEELLHVGFLSALSRDDIILPITDYLIKTHPDRKLDIQLLDFVDLRNCLLDKKLDFCVTTSFDWKVWPGVHTSILARKQFQVVYSDRSPIAHCSSLTLDDLANYTQLILPAENNLDGFEDWARRIPFRRAVACPDISTLMVRLSLGEGFAILTKVIEGHDAPHLLYMDVPFPEAHAEIVCMCLDSAPSEIKQAIHGIQTKKLIKI